MGRPRKRKIVKRRYPKKPDYMTLRNTAHNNGMTTHEYVEYLYEIYHQRQRKEIIEKINKSKGSSNWVRWSDEEVEVVKRKDLRVEEMSEILGRSVYSVIAKRRTLRKNGILK